MRFSIWSVSLVAVAALLTGCSDDDEATSTSDATTEASPALPEGTAATGDPVRIGFVNLEGGAAISLTELRIGAEAAVAYANDHLEGVGGRPIELVRCDTDGTEASSSDCANQMVDEGVAAVIMGQDGHPAAVASTVSQAGIPYFTQAGNSTEEFTSPGAFSVTGGVSAALAAFAQHASDEGYDSFDLVVIDTPAATGAANALGAALFAAAGVELNVTPVAPGTPDLAPQLTAVASGGADAVGLLADANLCTAFFRSAGQISLQLPKYVYGACISQSVFSSVPGTAIDGTFSAVTIQLGGDDEDFQTYRAVLDEYAGDDADPTSILMAQGYVAVTSFVRATQGLTGDPTPETISAAIEAVSDVDLPLGGGITFTCDGSAIPAFSQVCSAGELIVRLDAEGAPTTEATLDTTDLFPSGS